MKRVVVIAISVILALSLAAPIAYAQAHHTHKASHSTSSQDNNNQGNNNQGSVVVSPQDADYVKLSENWWQWALSIPDTDSSGNVISPVDDNSGANCGQQLPFKTSATQQSNSVWFLGSNLAATNPAANLTRSCTIPANTPIFLPILNGECSTIEHQLVPEPSGCTQSNLSNDIKAQLDGALTGSNMFATVDGKAIGGLNTPSPLTTPYRVVTPNTFSFTLPDNQPDNQTNVFTKIYGRSIPGGNYQAAGNGVYLLLNPLSAGTHTIHFGGQFAGFIQDNTYNLTVR